MVTVEVVLADVVPVEPSRIVMLMGPVSAVMRGSAIALAGMKNTAADTTTIATMDSEAAFSLAALVFILDLPVIFFFHMNAAVTIAAIIRIDITISNVLDILKPAISEEPDIRLISPVPVLGVPGGVMGGVVPPPGFSTRMLMVCIAVSCIYVSPFMCFMYT